MKKSLLLAALCCYVFFSKAQNTYPWASSGNVGIGTTNPNSQLQVSGLTILSNPNGSNYNENLRLPPSSTGDYSSIALGSTPGNYGTGIGQWTLIRYPATQNNMFSIRYFNTDYFNILNDGKIGVNTQSPVCRLDIEGSTATEFVRIQSNASGTGGFLDMYSSASNGFNASTVGFNTNGTPLVFNVAGAEKLRVLNTGNVGIGTTNPDQKLSVAGTIHSQAVKVDMTGWSDYVFKPAYNLSSLENVKSFIDKNHHLPGMPSEKEVIKNGADVGEMLRLQQQKIEELTLYLIEKDKQIQALQKDVSKLKRRKSTQM